MWERVLRKARKNRAEDNRLPKKQMGVSLLLGVIRPSVFCPARRRLFLSGAGDQRPANDPVRLLPAVLCGDGPGGRRTVLSGLPVETICRPNELLSNSLIQQNRVTKFDNAYNVRVRSCSHWGDSNILLFKEEYSCH